MLKLRTMKLVVSALVAISAAVCPAVAAPPPTAEIEEQRGEPQGSSVDSGGKAPDGFYRHSIGSSLFVLANLVPMKDPPHYGQLNYQYRLTRKDVVSAELITWRYHAPLGVPLGPDYGTEETFFPGYVQAYGVALAYKRFLWKGLYTALHAANMHQGYMDQDGDRIQSGYQLFLTFRLGYQLKLFKERFFVEPSIGATAWPVNTNLPDSFQREEDKYNSFFVGEAGAHFGVNF